MIIHIIENVHKHKIKVKICRGVREVEAVAGLDLGQEEARSAICRHGRDPDGFSALAEVSEEDGGGVLTHTFVQGSHGFQDVGGLIHNIVTDFKRLTQPTVGAIGFHGAFTEYQPTYIHTGILQHHT